MAEAGAGRGLTVPPTAAEMRRIQERADRDVFTEDKLGKTKKLPRDLMPEDFANTEKPKQSSSAMGDLMSQLDAGLKRKGMKTSREGNYVTVESFGEESDRVKKKARGGKVSASSRADGICKRGKTRGRMV